MRSKLNYVLLGIAIMLFANGFAGGDVWDFVMGGMVTFASTMSIYAESRR